MKFLKATKVGSLILIGYLISGCTSSGADVIDKLLGQFSSVPLLNSIPMKIIAQDDPLTVDINNIKDGIPGSDEGMTYNCYWDNVVDGNVTDTTKPCSTLPGGNANFNTGSGILNWTPDTNTLGNYEVKVSGSNSDGSSYSIFVVGVRLKFSGLVDYTSITGTSVTMVWTPNTNALAYQIFRLNTITGQYELFNTVNDGTAAGTTLTGLAPSTGYTFRVKALDNLGNLDGNEVSKSVTTTDLVRLALSPTTHTGPAGTAIPMTVTAYNSDSTPQTVGGLSITPSIKTGSTTGVFSSVTDNNNGTYSFTFTPQVIGSPAEIQLSANVTFYLINTSTITVTPGPVNTSNSSLTLSANSVVSGQSILVTALLKDSYNNLISSGVTVSFNKYSGTSTGTFSAVTNAGSGVYTTNYTGIVAGTAQTISVSVNGTPLSLTGSITVVPGDPVSANSTLTISATTVSSGSSVTVTATLKDANNNPVPSGVFVGFNKSGGTSTGTFDSTVNAGGGVYTTHYSGLSAGTAQTITVSFNSTQLTPTVSITVVPGPASLANSSLTLSNNSVSSGNYITATATLRDANNNYIDTGITVTFAATGGTSTGTFNSVSNLGNGIYSVRYTGVHAGTAQNIAVLINGTDLGFASPITVVPGSPSPSQSTITIGSASIMAGTATTITANLKDSNNNPISSGVAVSFSKSGGTSTGTLDVTTNAGSGVYTTTYTGQTAGSAQTIYLMADGYSLGPTVNVTVVPNVPSSTVSTLVLSANTVTAGNYITVTATIKDAYNNPISSGIVVAFDKSGGTSTGSFSAVVNQGNGVYTTNFTGQTAGTALTIQTNVNLAGFGPTGTVQVLVGPPSLANSSFTVSAATVASNSLVNLSATLKDSQNNPITTQYAISFDATGGTSSGTIANFVNNNNGNFTATYQGIQAGTAQTLRVLADGNPIAGLTRTIQVIPGAPYAANSSFSIGNTTVQSGTSTTLSMSLRDINNNAIIIDLTLNPTAIGFTKSTGTSDGTISSVTYVSGSNYTASYTGTTMGSAQTISLVVNSVAVGLTVNATVTAGPPTHMTNTGPSNPLPSIDCNGPYTLTLRDASENATSSLSALTISFSATPASGITGTIYSDSTCATQITDYSLPAMTSNFSFYYRSYAPQNFVFTLTPSDVSITAKNITLNNIAVLSWIGASAKFTMNGSGNNLVVDDSSGGGYAFYDVALDGTTMYAVDYYMNRILRYDTTTNALTGWLGHVGSIEKITDVDGGTNCKALNPSSADLTPEWCLGGRSYASSTNLINNPRNIAFDGTNLYVASGHRILRFTKSTGAFTGWYGKVNSISGGVTCTNGTASAGNTTPGWCIGGTTTSGTTDGQFNGVGGLYIDGNYLYAVDISNYRVQRIDISNSNIPVYAGWIGLIGTPPTGGDSGCNGKAAGNVTPGWCTGGVSARSSRSQNSLPIVNPGAVETPPPDEGFDAPSYITGDTTYLYVSDQNNYRVVRIFKSSAGLPTTGMFNGWIGYLYRTTVSVSPTIPQQTSGNYTSTWTIGGVTWYTNTYKGFYQTAGIKVDTTNGILYVTDRGYHKVIRVALADGQDYRWLGRVSASPTGGYTGCSSTPVSGVTPGWCTGGTGGSAGNLNGTFYNPQSIAINSNYLYVGEQENFRIQKFNISNGTFASWIGAGNIPTSHWQRSYNSGTTPSRSGIDDYSSWEGSTNAAYNGISVTTDNIFLTDAAYGRIKRLNRDGSIVGYVGIIGTFPPTGPAECIGYTSGMTPTWCTGGGRTSTGQTGIHGYYNPYALTADTNYVYVANYQNNRIDRIRISDGIYLGWIGRVSTSPTDGDSGCTSKVSGDNTPGWCIGGLASAAKDTGGYYYPRSVVFDHDNNLNKDVLYVVDSYSRLSKIDATNGNFISSLGSLTSVTGCTLSNGVPGTWCTTATANNATTRYGGINQAYSIAVNSNYIFVADQSNHRITRWDKQTGEPAGFIGKVTNVSQNTTNLDRVTANFTVNGKVTANGCASGMSTLPATTPGWCFAVSNAAGADIRTTSASDDGSMNSPRGIWADDTNIYVADTGNSRVLKYNATTGAFIGWQGYAADTTGISGCTVDSNSITQGWCKGGVSGPAKSLGGFDYPTGMSGDAYYVYVVDGKNNRTIALPR